MEKLRNILAKENARNEAELQHTLKALELSKTHDETSLRKYQIDSMERIYNRIGVKEMSINQFSGEPNSSLASLLPTLGFASAQGAVARLKD